MRDKILILTDGKAGHENQSKALVRALGCDYDLLPIQFRSRGCKALSYLLDHCRLRLACLFKPFQVAPVKYRAVVGTGSGTFYAAKVLARKLKVPCAVVLYPRSYRLASFNCILVPSFDAPKAAANIIPIPANLVANDAAFYEAGVKAFLERYTPSDKPAVAVIVGGPNKCSTMTVEWMKAELDTIFLNSEPCEHWVTTSRRTPPEVEALIETYPWDYKLIYSKDHFNPIPAFVKLAKGLCVTAESTGMLSEACTCGTAEVHALDNLNPGPHKFRRFVENLRTGGYIEGSRKIDLTTEIARAAKLLGF